MIGCALQDMHASHVVHGDLTTSNLMLRPSPDNSIGTLVVIDFGLSYTSTVVEDKAVDLYVLERAFLSTHAHSQALFDLIIRAYKVGKNKEGAAANDMPGKVLQRLIDVRARGRKKSMIG